MSIRELPAYVMTPGHGREVVVTTRCHRAAALARALCLRYAQPHGREWRYYFTASAARRWKMLLDGGFHVIIRNGQKKYTRDPKMRGLYAALSICRKEATCSP